MSIILACGSTYQDSTLAEKSTLLTQVLFGLVICFDIVLDVTAVLVIGAMFAVTEIKEQIV